MITQAVDLGKFLCDRGSSELAVIVPALNSERTLGTLLESIERSTVKPSRVVVVDGGSVDRTTRIAQRWNCDVISSDEHPLSRTEARNLAASRVKEPLLLFLDSDMEIRREVIGECVTLLTTEWDAVVLREDSSGTGLLGTVRNWERGVLQRDLALTFARAVRRGVFEAVGGFDTRYIGLEDLDLQAKLLERGYRVGIGRHTIIHHEEQLGIIEYIKKRGRYAQSIPLYRRNHPQVARSTLSVSRRIWLYGRAVTSVSDVPLFASAVTLKAAEFIAGSLSAFSARRP